MDWPLVDGSPVPDKPDYTAVERALVGADKEKTAAIVEGLFGPPEQQLKLWNLVMEPAAADDYEEDWDEEE